MLYQSGSQFLANFKPRQLGEERPAAIWHFLTLAKQLEDPGILFRNLESENLGLKWDETGVLNVSATRMWGIHHQNGQQKFYMDL